jgi:hypothetical protein
MEKEAVNAADFKCIAFPGKRGLCIIHFFIVF